MRSAWYYTANRAPNAGSVSAAPAAALLLGGALLMLPATPAAGQSTRGTTVWSATLTVAERAAVDRQTNTQDFWKEHGCGLQSQRHASCDGKLTSRNFTYANTRYAVLALTYETTVSEEGADGYYADRVKFAPGVLTMILDKPVPNYRGNLGLYIGEKLFAAEAATVSVNNTINSVLGYPCNRSGSTPWLSTGGSPDAAPSSAGTDAPAAGLAGLSEVDGWR